MTVLGSTEDRPGAAATAKHSEPSMNRTDMYHARRGWPPVPAAGGPSSLTEPRSIGSSSGRGVVEAPGVRSAGRHGLALQPRQQVRDVIEQQVGHLPAGAVAH